MKLPVNQGIPTVLLWCLKVSNVSFDFPENYIEISSMGNWNKFDF